MVDLIQQNALYIFTHDWKDLDKIKLHLKGQHFNLKSGKHCSKSRWGNYQLIEILPESFTIQRHHRLLVPLLAVIRSVFDSLSPVIQSTGAFGQYHWGNIRKTAMIGWEAARVLNN